MLGAQECLQLQEDMGTGGVEERRAGAVRVGAEEIERCAQGAVVGLRCWGVRCSRIQAG